MERSAGQRPLCPAGHLSQVREIGGFGAGSPFQRWRLAGGEEENDLPVGEISGVVCPYSRSPSTMAVESCMVMRAVGARGRCRQAAAEHVRPRARADGIVFHTFAQREIERRAAAAEQTVEEAHRRDMRLAAGVFRGRRRRELVEMRFGFLALSWGEPGRRQRAGGFAGFGFLGRGGSAGFGGVLLRKGVISG
ncbi:hypothetical protein MPL3365_70278 [Mesorhizobium plurifarium]|uniref:Uncharacterized protein n=1 Tax=Mesorhizobium plurifarium TaxID=69974 RepID=A0A090GH70_MESPL|nr:hypothetical protein MPL3365_70278 [Mesorhizobium plurifarium]